VVQRFEYSDPVGKNYRLPVAMTYAVDTKVGHCGLPIFLVDPSTRSKKFIGFHVAGSKSHGMCYLFPKPENYAPVAVAQMATSEILSMVHCGKISRPIGTSGVSNILKSPLYGAYGPALKAPARLKGFYPPGSDVKVYPMDIALARYNKPVVKLEQRLVVACTRAAIVANTDATPFKIKPVAISLEQAVLGVPGLEFMDGVNRNTSPGYPWNMAPRPGYKGKERFFGKGMEIDFSGPDWPQLQEQIIADHEMLKNGVRPRYYFSDSLKDELLKIEKVESGNTRLFCPCPVVYQILFNMYFKDFAVKFMESRIVTEHAVGINVYSVEWDMLARKLKSFGEERIFAGDFKQFDASQKAQILEAIGEAIIECFGDREHDGIRRLLWKEVFNSFHIVGNDIYEWRQSLPSGHPFTTITNCLFVSTVMRMCWVKANDDNLSSLRTFMLNVCLVVYGDDNVVAVSKAAAEMFNQHTLEGLMKLFGLIYTSELKEGQVAAFRGLEGVEFLKRSFHLSKRTHRYVAPLRLESVMEMPYWSKKEGYEEIWRTNVENALRELSLHQPEVRDEEGQKIIRASEEAGYKPVITDWNVLLDEVTKQGVLYGARR